MTAEKKPKSGAETAADDDTKTTARAATPKKTASAKATATTKKAAAKKTTAAKKATPTKKAAAPKKSTTAKEPAPAAAVQTPEVTAEPVEPTAVEAKDDKPKATKATAKKAAPSKIRITQVRSQIGFAKAQRKVLAGLGLGRIGRSVVRNDDPCIRGMVAKVSHLVAVEEVEA